jgi:hypothetical protein
MREGSKNLLFLKKKKQKDFSDLAPAPDDWQTGKSFFVLFFKKERASFHGLTLT